LRISRCSRLISPFAGDPPYSLPQHSLNASHNGFDSSRVRQIGDGHLNRRLAPSANDSSADDFRSVIDDLTIQNQKLKERLRRYEASYGAQLEKDKLFEVKIHGLSAQKKRELEETLQSFAASVYGSSDSPAAKQPRRDAPAHMAPSKNSSSISTSNSRLVDSAYASMSNSGPASTTNEAGKDRSTSRDGKERNVQSFLQNIPEELMPKHPSVITERQKQKIVVRRLEELFTGKTATAIVVGDHSQPHQQQEVSESAAFADQAANPKPQPLEGAREAHILPYELLEVDSKRPAKLAEDSSHDSRCLSGSAGDSPASSVEQRPTRPLDLDPDRAQVPSDNVEYIRHLGLSPPHITGENVGAAQEDGDGWIYLNLLINMAQLHIINVTTDFVRSAVADVSENFQVSRDGRKLRWKGGTEGTRLSGDSGASSVRHRSAQESGNLDEADRKRRKLGFGRFASIPVTLGQNPLSVSAPSKTLHYRPLFHHKNSSSEGSTSFGESISPFGYGGGSEVGGISRVPRMRSRPSNSASRSRDRHDDGPIVFYGGANFCIDLSGDRGDINTPSHDTGIGKDGYSNHTQDALGCSSKQGTPALNRTPSGSSLPFRPFKDYSQPLTFMQTEKTLPSTPALLSADAVDLDVNMGQSPADSAPKASLLDFAASGLGGTQPADHFFVNVETRRTVVRSRTQTKLSRFSAPRPATTKFIHTIQKRSLDSFDCADVNKSAEAIASRLSPTSVFRPPSPRLKPVEELPVRTETMSAKFSRLPPSELPPPVGYYTDVTDSEDISDCTSSSVCSGPWRLKAEESSTGRSTNIFREQVYPLRQVHIPTEEIAPDSVSTEDDESADSDEEEDSDEGFDMLDTGRAIDPGTIAMQEQDFELQRNRSPLGAVQHSGSAPATLDSKSQGLSGGVTRRKKRRMMMTTTMMTMKSESDAGT
jgi:hypothetical protein